MTTSAQFIGVMVMLLAVFAVALMPLSPSTRLLAAGVVITVSAGTMAFLRSRTASR